MFGTDVAVANCFGFLASESQCLFAVIGQWHLYGGGNTFSARDLALDFGLDLALGAQSGKQMFGDLVILAENPQEKMFCLDRGAAVHAGFVAGEENDAASPFGVTLEHDSASLFQGYGIRQLAWLERWRCLWRRG